MPAPVPTWAQVVPGQYDTAALFNAVSTNGGFLSAPPIFQAWQSAAQSVATGTVTAVGMNTTDVDSYTGHSNVTNNSRYTPQAAGWYLFIGSVSLVQNATSNRLAEFRKNGAGSAANLAQAVCLTPDTNNPSAVRPLALILCNGTTDYVELYAYQTSGSSLNTVPGQTGMSAFWIHS